VGGFAPFLLPPLRRPPPPPPPPPPPFFVFAPKVDSFSHRPRIQMTAVSQVEQRN